MGALYPVILSWNPNAGDPCHICQQAPPPSSFEYPNWDSISFDSTTDMQYLYRYQTPFVGTETLWGGHTILTGPGAPPDPGPFFEPVNLPIGFSAIYYVVTKVFIRNSAPDSLPNIAMSGSDPSSLQQADWQAQWQAFNFVQASG